MIIKLIDIKYVNEAYKRYEKEKFITLEFVPGYIKSLLGEKPYRKTYRGDICWYEYPLAKCVDLKLSELLEEYSMQYDWNNENSDKK